MDKKYFIDVSRFDEERNKEKLDIIRNTLFITNNSEDADFILSIGGDGCLLNSIYNSHKLKKPFIGIHGGTVGYYMQDILKHNVLNPSVEYALKKGNFHYTEFPMLKIHAIGSDGEVFNGYAFGDCWAERSGPSSLKYNICLKKDNMPLFCSNKKFVSGDGILFSTAAGSTGYAKNILDFIMPVGSSDILVAPIHSTTDEKRKLVGFNMDKTSTIIIDFQNVDFRVPKLNIDGKEVKSKITGESFSPIYLEISMSKTKTVNLAHIDKHFLELKSFDYLIN